MTSPLTTSQQDEAAAEADVVAFLQFLLFVCGTSAGTFDRGWTWPVVAVLVAGLVLPAARSWAERRVWRRVPVGEGTPSSKTRGKLAALVVLAASLSMYDRPSDACSTLIIAPILGLAADNLLSSFMLAFDMLRRARSVRGWTRVEVLSVHEGIATIQSATDVVLARVDGALPLGVVYVDMDHLHSNYRVGAAARIRDFESHETRRRRRSLVQLAALRLSSGLMWVAVVLSPLVGRTLGR